MVIDRGSGNAAFDGADVIAGQEELDLNGALRMVITPDASGNAYGYDQNGNRSYWLKEGQAHVYTHDAENRLIEVKQNGALLMSFVYDGDPARVRRDELRRVKSTLVVSPSNTTTYYTGNHSEYEIVGQSTTLRRYFAVYPRCNAGDREQARYHTSGGRGGRLKPYRYSRYRLALKGWRRRRLSAKMRRFQL